MSRMLAALAAVLVTTAAAADAASPDGASQGAASSAAAVEVGTASAQATGDGSTATATATCPGGTKAAGGGFEAPPSDDAVGLVYESVKVHQRGWRASVQLFDPGDPNTLTLTTYVYCRAHFPATRTDRATMQTTGELGIGPTATATCPHDTTALAGGFQMPPPLSRPDVTELVFDSLRSDTTHWHSRVVTGTAGPSSVTSEVYCSGAVAPPVEVATSSPPIGIDSVPGAATAACPSGLTPSAGGFAQPDSAPVSFFLVYASKRVDDGWQVSGLHRGGEPAVALSAAAYCG